MFYLQTFVDFNLTSMLAHCSICVCHMSLKGFTYLLTYLGCVGGLYVVFASCLSHVLFIGDSSMNVLLIVCLTS